VNLLHLTLSDREFQSFADLVHKKAGINLHSGKRELVRSRLAKRIREGGFENFNNYYQYVIQDETGTELVTLLDSISTNLTRFFREPGHFQFMTDTFLPRFTGSMVKKRGYGLRIWSAGCSTGEEPYSIVMTVLDYSPQFRRADFKVLATDLSTRVLSVAWRGSYPRDIVADIPLSRLRKYFKRGHGPSNGWFQVKNNLRQPVVFRRLNLIEPFPFKKKFDLIFCRNVMIYFNKQTQAGLVVRFQQALADGGYLFIGHSESLTGVEHNLKYIQPTIYRKG
jgi:chemotaxis protein methyltransferase CheR